MSGDAEEDWGRFPPRVQQPQRQIRQQIALIASVSYLVISVLPKQPVARPRILSRGRWAFFDLTV
jgi:hypothetical protein